MDQVLPACCQLTTASRRSLGAGAESLHLRPCEQEEVVLLGRGREPRIFTHLLGGMDGVLVNLGP